MANVFISHRGFDKVEAERLAEEIRRCGHDVWLDEWQLEIGQSLVGEINKGLLTATYLVLCFSDAGVTSPWMSREWMSGLARQLNGDGIKLLPARLTGGSPPPILADLKYADLVTDWATGIKELCSAIK